MKRGESSPSYVAGKGPGRVKWILFAALLASCADRSPEHPEPSAPIDLEAARQYVVALVNRDRGEHGLEPVTLDEQATRAAQRHVEDMARNGFTAHWGTDGSVPEERYTQAGGVHLVQENAACFSDGVARTLEPNPLFFASDLEPIQAAIMNEVPPGDGHRRNILQPSHTGVGIGLALPVGITRPCLVQELIDARGSYLPLPQRARVGERIRIEGEVFDPGVVAAVGLGRLEPPATRTVAELNATTSYRIPEPYALYYPRGYETAVPIEVEGGRFSLEVALDERGLAGRYEVSVWARYPGLDELVIVSLRTIEVVAGSGR